MTATFCVLQRQLKVRHYFTQYSSISPLCFSDSEHTTAKLWQMQLSTDVVNINDLHTKSKHAGFVNNPKCDSIACNPMHSACCVYVCEGQGRAGWGRWQIRLVWTILSIWFNWFVECAGACDSVQQMAFHSSESWHSSIDNEQSCICWYAKVPVVKVGYGPPPLLVEIWTCNFDW